MVEKKDNDILSLSDKSLYIFYHEAKGFKSSRRNGKQLNMHIIHIRIRDQEVGKKFRIRIR